MIGLPFSLAQASLAGTILAATAGTFVSLTPPNPNKANGKTKDSLAALALTDKSTTTLALSPWVGLGLYQSSLAYCYPIVPTRLLGYGLENGLNTNLIKWSPSTAVPLALILCVGIPLRLIPYSALGKNFTFSLAEPDGLTTTGIYRYVQHPSYTGILTLAFCTPALFARPDGVLGCIVPPQIYEYLKWAIVGLAPVVATLLIGAIRTRVREEEQMLHSKFGREWEEWHSRTARFIPWLYGYQAFNSSPSGYNWTNYADIAVFKNIPFAASTAGENRLKPPQPVAKWNSTLYASEFGDSCVGGSFDTSGDPESEDCLNLNVWTPANSSNAKLPVVMWSYPAGGSNRQALFNGGGMAHAGVVFVNYNYRSGAFGWMAHPWLSEEREAATGFNSSGNYAMLDQFAALKWIRENIAAFGGDPDHITVQSQSAGSAATYHILNSPLTKSEIVGAIIESGVRDPHDPDLVSLAEGYRNLTTNLKQGIEVFNLLNITSLEQARSVSYEIYVSGAAASYEWSATLDGYAMPATYLDTLLHGSANQVPVITGNTKDESGATYGLNISLAEYLADNKKTYSGEWVQKFFDLYPANDSTTVSGAENSQYTDRSKAGTYLWTRLWQNASSEPVWNYFWNHAPPGQTRGAYHESEINYVLNNLYLTDLPWEAVDYTIAEKMNGYWVNFIKTGNPNGAGLVDWPAVTEQNEAKVQVIGKEFANEPVVSKEKLQLFIDWFASLPSY